MQKSNAIKLIFMFFILILLQVLVLNRIAIFNYATPFLYIYFIIKLPISLNRNILLLLSFTFGFIIDIFCNTPGINALATTVTAFVQQPLRRILYATDDYTEQIPTYSALRGVFIKSALVTVLLHHTILIVIESLSYVNMSIVVLRIISSTILTFILIFGLEGLTINKKVA